MGFLIEVMIFYWTNYITLQQFVPMGLKGLKTSAYFISGPRLMPKRKTCPRTNEGNPDYQDILPMMTLSSAVQNHKRERHHVARGNPLEDPKRDSKPHGLDIGAW